jgi:hypothetical protein
MRRMIAISLVVFFGLPLISPLFALGPEGMSTLAACCRRNGAHKCALTMEQATALTQGTHFNPVPDCCPQYPKAISPAPHHYLSFNAAALLFAEVVSHPATHAQTEAWARIALDGARQKRGPPAVRLS